MTIIIAPKRADMSDTIIKVNAQPSSPAVSVTKKKKIQKVRMVFFFILLLFENLFMFICLSLFYAGNFNT